MDNKKVKLTPPETFDRFLELPLHDLMVPGISKYMKLKDILSFRCCSRYCKELAESALAARRSVEITDVYPHKPGAKLFFDVIIKHCRHLRKIKLNYLSWINDEMVISVINNNPLLEDVFLNFCRPLTPKALYPLVNCKNLIRLSLQSLCDDTFLEMLNQHEIHLEELNILNNDRFSEEGLCSFFRKQPRLTNIYLPAVCHKAQEIFETIGESCQELRCLSTKFYSKRYHEEGLKRLLRVSPKLEKIRFRDYWELSNSLKNLLHEQKVKLEWAEWPRV